MVKGEGAIEDGIAFCCGDEGDFVFDVDIGVWIDILHNCRDGYGFFIHPPQEYVERVNANAGENAAR